MPRRRFYVTLNVPESADGDHVRACIEETLVGAKTGAPPSPLFDTKGLKVTLPPARKGGRNYRKEKTASVQ